MIGRQTTRKIDRFTFDIEYLYSGFNLIVVIVGIFALSQALNLMVGKDDDPPEARISGGLFTGFRDLISNKLIAVISACYGTVMGIIPGVGEFVAQFFSYSTARAISKDPARFGHGSPEGLLASETSNNAVPAAAMIPLLALGVPGEALTAMMMVVFFDAGIKPGPDIFDTNPDFLFSLFSALFLINVFVLITLLFSTKVHCENDIYSQSLFGGDDHDLVVCRRLLNPQQFRRLYFCGHFWVYWVYLEALELAACAYCLGIGLRLYYIGAPHCRSWANKNGVRLN